ncbi:MAG: 3'-5' exonuclease [Thermoleophilaceae bacterium]
MVTMHSAKGLEYPIVMLANLAGDRPLVEKASAGCAGAGDRAPGGGDATRGGSRRRDSLRAREREKELEAAERLRPLYVAATRARVTW